MLQRAFASRAVLSGEKLVCLGKMYLEHASKLSCLLQHHTNHITPLKFSSLLHSCPEELGDAVPDKPVIFNKFGSVTHRAPGGGKVLDVSHILPKDRGPIHYEAEICLQLGVSGFLAGQPSQLLRVRFMQSINKCRRRPAALRL